MTTSRTTIVFDSGLKRCPNRADQQYAKFTILSHGGRVVRGAVRSKSRRAGSSNRGVVAVLKVHRRLLASVFVVILGFVVIQAGCSGLSKGSTGSQTPNATNTTAAGNAGSGSAVAGQIPPGREIAESGGGPTQYTFREEWRRALATAQKWRGGAYLITATGDMMNDDGVPSSWRLLFIDKAAADALLMVDLDPWGKVTSQRELTGSEVGSFVNAYTKAIPYDVMDSDKVVGVGKEALAARYDLAKTKDPRVGLNYSVIDGSGPYWVYTLFYTSNAEYVTARMDALTGKVVPEP